MLAMKRDDETRDLADDDQDLEAELDFALHDLAQPLTALQLTLEALQHDPEDRAELLVEALTIARSARAQLRDLESVREGRSRLRSTVDLQDVVTAVRVQHRLQLHAQGIKLHGLGGSVPVWGHRELLLRVFRNLVDNTLRHGVGARNLWVRAFMAGSTARVVIRDDGPGWSGRTPELTSGRGLAFCRHALETLGGTLEVGTGLSGGEFLMTLPAVRHLGDELSTKVGLR